MGSSGTDGADRGARAPARARDDSADSPAEFAEAFRDGLADAACADDGN